MTGRSSICFSCQLHLRHSQFLEYYLQNWKDNMVNKVYLNEDEDELWFTVTLEPEAIIAIDKAIKEESEKKKAKRRKAAKKVKRG